MTKSGQLWNSCAVHGCGAWFIVYWRKGFLLITPSYVDMTEWQAGPLGLDEDYSKLGNGIYLLLAEEDIVIKYHSISLWSC